MKLGNPGNCHDITNLCIFHFHLFKTVKFVQTADFYLQFFILVMRIDNHHILIYLQCTVFHLSYTDTSHILIVIDGTDQHLCRCFRISLRRRHIIQNRIQQRTHIFRFILHIPYSISAFRGSIYKRAIQLFFRSVQLNE